MSELRFSLTRLVLVPVSCVRCGCNEAESTLSEIRILSSAFSDQASSVALLGITRVAVPRSARSRRDSLQQSDRIRSGKHQSREDRRIARVVAMSLAAAGVHGDQHAGLTSPTAREETDQRHWRFG
jgi:hypothetical protein